jgi:hypothetical protein
MSYVSLATTTLSSATSSVTFGSIPATFKDLVLVIDATTLSGIRGGIIQVNGSSSGYSFVYANGDGSSATSASGTASAFSQTAFLTTRSTNIMHFMDYAATDKHKTALVRFGQAGLSTQMAAERWASTSAITSISVAITVTSFAAGSTFSLYGIA